MLNPLYISLKSPAIHIVGTFGVFGFMIFTLLFALPAVAQSSVEDSEQIPEPQQLITVYKVPVKTQFGERLPTIQLRSVSLYRPLYFKNAQERVRFTRLMRDVKKTLPYAKIVSRTLKETYEYMETLPNEKAKIKHLKRMEHELFEQYKPDMKKLTLSQGKLLMKLIHRETNSSSYQLLDAFLGSFAAGFWNLFANLFGGDLHTTWDPYGEDAEIEHVCVLIEYGMI